MKKLEELRAHIQSEINSGNLDLKDIMRKTPESVRASYGGGSGFHGACNSIYKSMRGKEKENEAVPLKGLKPAEDELDIDLWDENDFFVEGDVQLDEDDPDNDAWFEETCHQPEDSGQDAEKSLLGEGFCAFGIRYHAEKLENEMNTLCDRDMKHAIIWIIENMGDRTSEMFMQALEEVNSTESIHDRISAIEKRVERIEERPGFISGYITRISNSMRKRGR